MIREEFAIQRYSHGIKLVECNKPGLQYPLTSVGDIMSLPLNFYFMDCNSVMIRINEVTAETNGYLSMHDAIGKSIRNISKNNSADAVLANDRVVIESKALLVMTETFLRCDDIELNALSLKFPWYHKNDVIGILGCSILFDYQDFISLSDALTLLIQTGLLAPTAQKTIRHEMGGRQIDGKYFDQRDADIMLLLVRGKTAKSIGRELSLSHRTIEHRLEIIKHKLGISSKPELIERIIDQFFIHVDS